MLLRGTKIVSNDFGTGKLGFGRYKFGKNLFSEKKTRQNLKDEVNFKIIMLEF